MAQLIEEAMTKVANCGIAPGFGEIESEWISLAQLGGVNGQVNGMLICSAAMRKVMVAIARIAPYKTTVLIHGETGTGKDLISRAIHRQGPFPNGPFVTFNCSNLVDTLAESQLFGHVKGAFTDAREESLGYFRSANGGTLFLDEVGELPLKLQPKLLRVVESKEVQPVGSARTYRVDTRLVCASNRDLKAMVEEGSFRADLYYRLNTTGIVVPPLRERREAIPTLVAHFIDYNNREIGKNVKFISRRALESLCSFAWPGNVRQLAHTIESTLIMIDADRISLHDLPDTVGSTEYSAESQPTNPHSPEVPHLEVPASVTIPTHSLEVAIDRATRNALSKALQATAGNCVRAAELLGVSRYTVYRMISRHGLTAQKGRGAAFLCPPPDGAAAQTTADVLG